MEGEPEIKPVPKSPAPTYYWNEMIACPHCRMPCVVRLSRHTDSVIFTQCKGQEQEHDWVLHENSSHWAKRGDPVEVQ